MQFIQKLNVREYVKSLGIPYTFIDVGWWMEFILPRPVSASDIWTGSSWRLYGDGNTPVALTDLDRIPDFVARIVQDERTINKVVFASENEATQNEAWEYAAKSPEAAEILKKKNPVGTPIPAFECGPDSLACQTDVARAGLVRAGSCTGRL